MRNYKGTIRESTFLSFQSKEFPKANVYICDMHVYIYTFCTLSIYLPIHLPIKREGRV